MKYKKITRRIVLFEYAKLCLGKDMAPVEDEYGCMEAVANIAKRVGIIIGGGASTYFANRFFRRSKKFKKIASFKPATGIKNIRPGQIVISATGYGGTKAVPNGHVGIISDGKKIMSNNSKNGLWEENYTLASWYKRYVTKGKYPMDIYEVIG